MQLIIWLILVCIGAFIGSISFPDGALLCNEWFGTSIVILPWQGAILGVIPVIGALSIPLFVLSLLFL